MVSRIDNIKVPSLKDGFNIEDAEREIENYITELYDTLVTSSPANLLDFFPLVQNVIRVKEEEEEIKEDKRLLLLEDDPPEEIDTESITWKLKARVPGRFDQGPAGQGRIKEIIPHARAINIHPEHPNEKLVTMGKFYGNWIEFNIYARDKKQCLRRLLWFEEVMDSFHWYFRLYGFRVIEEGVGDREKVKIKDLDLIKYPVTYFVRSDDTFNVTTQVLKSILITTNVSIS